MRPLRMVSGCQGEDVAAQPRHVPLLFVALPVAVEPEEIGMVAVGELLDLAPVEDQEALPGLGVVRRPGRGIGEAVAVEVGRHLRRADARVVGVRPVEVGEVEAHLEPLGPQRVGVGLEEVPLRPGSAITSRSLSSVGHRAKPSWCFEVRTA